MTYENLCMYCFEDMRGQTTCPHCGRDSRAAVPQVQMLPGSRVYHDRFLIGRALGQDATGIVYAALDTKRDNKLRIREYLPRDCAERLNDGAVVPVAGMEDQFEAGIKKLRASVESVEDPRKRHFFFEENGTAYIAQRKSAAPAAAEAPAREEEGGGGRRVLLFAGIAVAVLVVAAVLLITVFNGALPTSRDITQSPTLDPSEVWIPATTPTPTPYVAPTFAALVDPELSWMDYTYEGDVEQDYQQARRASTTPTPAPTATRKADNTGYSLINGNSDSKKIRTLQRRLSALGWLDGNDITGEYDSATRQAVRDFQRYINERYNPEQKLSVDGAAGPKTQQWLYEADAAKPTPTPTPKVTPKPDDSAVDGNSPASLVRPVQRKLITLGLLPEDSADGSYGATTAAAVRRFQKRVNQLAGYDVLEVTGRMDAQSLAFLDYYAEEWARLREATAEPTATPEPTRRPTATPTTRPVENLSGVIDNKASTEDIRKVQQLLVDIGLLPKGGVDGVYGGDTVFAVTDFQQWVNEQRDEQTLTVNGQVDQMTLAYLQYCKDHGLTPYGTPTPAPTRIPTEAPTQAPTEAPGIGPEGDYEDEPEESQEITIDAGSDPESIRYVQNMLSAVGAMESGGVDGVYGKGTTRAVKRFQKWVNSVQGEDTLEVSGRMDNATRLQLEYAYERGLTMSQPTEAPTAVPTETPTAEPTEIPTPEPTEPPVEDEPEEPEGSQEITVGEDSDPESIRFVQQMLSAVGVLDGSDITGRYDAATRDAVRAFQAWVNQVQGSALLPVTGQVDDNTRRALEYAYDRNLRAEGSATGAPEPTGIPKAGPTEAPSLGRVGDIGIAFDGEIAGDDVVVVSEGKLTVRWRAEGEVDSYFVYVQDSSGHNIAGEEGTEHTGFTVNTDQMAPGEVYTLRLGVMPARGDEDDIVWRTAQFMLPQKATPEPEPEPTVAEISAPRISIAGTVAGSSTITLTEDTVQVVWSSSGDVESYYLRVTDEDGDDIFEPRYTTQTGFNLRTDDMQPGMLYTLTVGALPAGGTNADMQYSRAQFMRPATPQPTEIPTPPPTEVPTPAPQVATIGMPVVNIGGSAYQVDGVSIMTDSNIIISWNADGDVQSYTIYVENQAGERQELGTTTDTSRTVNARSLPAGLYTIYVGALPAGGDRDDMQWGSARFGIPAPTDAPTEAPEIEPEGDYGDDDPASVMGSISGSSDADTVQQLQMKLYSLGLLSTDGLEPGVLDEATLQAVAEFQTRMNDQFDAGLNVVDPDDLTSVVDSATVRAIFAS